MGSDSCQVLSRNMIWARFSRAQALGEMPELSVFSLKTLHRFERHTQVVKIRLDDFTAGLPSWCEAGDKSAGRHPRSPDVRLKKKKPPRASVLSFFLNT